MRRKQLYAIILAGALAASSAPAAVFAAEGDVTATAETSEENPVDGETAAATEAPAEEHRQILQQQQRHRQNRQWRRKRNGRVPARRPLSRHSRLQKRHWLYRKHPGRDW
ncbi:MAG: hypothetical protein ACLVB1_06205 [Blautia obeum]